MYVLHGGLGRILRRRVWIIAVGLPGCGLGTALPGGDGLPSTLNLAAIESESEAAWSGRNQAFDGAEPWALSTELLAIEGRIEFGADVHIYDLGPVVIGDRILVTLTRDPSLHAAMGLFDATGAALLINDHRNVYLGRTEPYINVIVQHASAACYVAVSATPGYESVGDYGLVASKEVSLDPPAPRGDTVLLVFHGGSAVRIGSRPAVDVPPFDAANISPDLAGHSSFVAEEITRRVREDFRGFDVLVLSTSEGAAFEPGMTRVYFGAFDAGLLGVAEGIDEFNATPGQQAIIFTDTFRAFTRLRPSVDDLSQAMANVASHEIGHLLGMVHTADPGGLMDVTASLAALTRDQVFTRSPIYAEAFPIGDQDAVRYLLDVVGGDEQSIYARRTSPAPWRRIDRREDDSPPARLGLRLSSCGLEGH